MCLVVVFVKVVELEEAPTWLLLPPALEEGAFEEPAWLLYWEFKPEENAVLVLLLLSLEFACEESDDPA